MGTGGPAQPCRRQSLVLRSLCSCLRKPTSSKADSIHQVPRRPTEGQNQKPFLTGLQSGPPCSLDSEAWESPCSPVASGGRHSPSLPTGWQGSWDQNPGTFHAPTVCGRHQILTFPGTPAVCARERMKPGARVKHAGVPLNENWTDEHRHACK